MSRRRTVFNTASIAAILVAASTTATVSTSAYANANCVEHLEIVAYQGGSGHAPEYTSAAFVRAVKNSPNQLQVDVRMSADGVPVLLHDKDLQRTTDVAEVFPERRNDPVASFTLDELQQLDVGAWYDERFAGEKVLTLKDVLGYIFPNRIGLSVTPQDLATTPGLAEAISDEFESDKRWTELLKAGLIEFSSDNADTIKAMVDLQPMAETLWILETLPDAAGLKENSAWADAIGQDYREFTPEDAVRIHQADMIAALYGVDSPSAVTQSQESGADKVFTEFPDVPKAVCADDNPLKHANGITISKVVADVEGSDVQARIGEHVVLANDSEETIDVSGYQIRNASGRRLSVGDEYVLPPGGELQVYTGSGLNTAKQFYNEKRVNLLHNLHDTLSVYDTDGNCVELYAY